MHEEALLRDLRRKLVELSSRDRGVSIRRVRLWVGALAHVSPEALRRRWSEVVDGTPAGSAELDLVISDDPAHPDAQGIRLVEIGVEEPNEAPPIEAPRSRA
jgi:hydrogenase nickel incorporation protein HypA/HybF